MTDLTTTTSEIELHECSFNDRNTHVMATYTVSDRDSAANVVQRITVGALYTFIQDNGLNVHEHFSSTAQQEQAKLDIRTYLQDNLRDVVCIYLAENLKEDGE